MKHYQRYLWCCFGLMWQAGMAQTGLRYEYWFNNNIHTRNSNALVPNNAQGDISFSMRIDTLPLGLNTAHIRFTKNDTSWSSTSSYLFYRSNDTINTAITAGQYWFNDNFAARDSFQTDGTNISKNIDIQSLTNGLHRFNIRFRGSAGYSSVSTYLFYRLSDTTGNAINTAEYWFNDNFAARDSFQTDGTNVSKNIDIQSLTNGLHRFNIRFRGSAGYSSVSTYLFYRLNDTTGNAITSAEYWFNDNFTARDSFQTDGTNVSKNIDIQSLTNGLHRFNIRFRGSAGYSSVSTYLFYRSNITDTNSISTGQYWFDNNFAQQDTFRTDGQNISKSVNIDALSVGLHKFHIRFWGMSGYSSVSTYLFYKLNNNLNDSLEYWWHNDLLTRKSVSLPVTDSVTVQLPLFEPLCDGWYYLNMRFLKNKQWSSALRDSVYLRANINITTNLMHTTCGLSNGSINVTPPNSGTLQYALNNGSFQSAPIFNNLNSGNYTVKIKDATGCQLSKSLIINASAPARIVDTTLKVCHSFQLGDTLLTDSGTYRRTLRSFMDCDSFVTVRLTVNQVRRDTFPTIISCQDNRRDSLITSIIQSVQGCDSIIRVVALRYVPHLTVAFDTTPTCTARNTGSALLRLNRPSNQVQIRWSRGDTTLNINQLGVGTYTVTITDKTICNDIKIATIPIRAARTLVALAQKSDACAGQSNGIIQIFVQGGAGAYRYQWSDSSRTTSFAKDLKSGLYQVTVTDSLDCDRTTLQIQILSTNNSETVKKDTFHLCSGDTLRVYDRVFSAQGSQEFTYPNLGGCYTSVKMVVLFKPTNVHHHLNPVPQDTTIQMGDSIELKLIPNFKPITIHWKPNSCANCLTHWVQPFTNQTYWVEAQDSQKCVMRDTVFVKVKRGAYEIPNAYYPDRGEPYKVYPDKAIQSINRLRIYDRWGNLIYDSQTQSTDWNGKFNDEFVPSGVYVVFLETTLKNGQPEKITSDLTIIR